MNRQVKREIKRQAESDGSSTPENHIPGGAAT
jgi:hypothetical protein